MRLNLGEKGGQGLQEDQEADQRAEKQKYVGDDGDDGRPPNHRRLSHRRPPTGRVVTGAMIVIGPAAPLNA